MSEFERHMDQAAERYVAGLDLAGLEPNATLTRAVAERACESYRQQSLVRRDQNIRGIIAAHDTKLNQIKREGASLRLKTCPPIALFFGLTSWYCFASGNPIGGFILATGAVGFSAMLVLGAIFDRPRK